MARRSSYGSIDDNHFETTASKLAIAGFERVGNIPLLVHTCSTSGKQQKTWLIITASINVSLYTQTEFKLNRGRGMGDGKGSKI